MALVDEAAMHDVVDELGDFTATPRVLLLAVAAVAIGLVSAVLAKALLALIAIEPNAFFFLRWSTAAVSAADAHLGAWVIVVPVVGHFHRVRRPVRRRGPDHHDRRRATRCLAPGRSFQCHRMRRSSASPDWPAACWRAFRRGPVGAVDGSRLCLGRLVHTPADTLDVVAGDWRPGHRSRRPVFPTSARCRLRHDRVASRRHDAIAVDRRRLLARADARRRHAAAAPRFGHRGARVHGARPQAVNPDREDREARLSLAREYA